MIYACTKYREISVLPVLSDTSNIVNCNSKIKMKYRSSRVYINNGGNNNSSSNLQQYNNSSNNNNSKNKVAAARWMSFIFERLIGQKLENLEFRTDIFSIFFCYVFSKLP